MYLSKLILNPLSRQVRSELSNAYQMHRTLMSAFPKDLDNRERILYRLETRPEKPHLILLVQSHLEPDWSFLDGKDYLMQPVEKKEFEVQYSTGQVFLFRLAANPTKRVKVEQKKIGKRVGLYLPEEQQAWLERKALQHGFEVLAVQMVRLGGQNATKKENDGERMKIVHEGVLFNGALRVVDPGRFATALERGIGSAKGFGFGLLSIARSGSIEIDQ